MRSIFNGSIAWGMVSVPIKMIAATESHDVALHQVHKDDGGRVKYVKQCADCGEELHGADIAKAFSHDDGSTRILSDDELAGDASKELEVLAFVPKNSVDTLMIEKTYYLQPGAKVPRAYTLLTAAMLKSKKDAAVRFTLRGTQRIGMLTVRKIGAADILTLHALHWADEVREPVFTELSGEKLFTPAELTAAMALVDSLATDWEPNTFVDEAQEKIRAIVEQPSQEKSDDAVVSDLLARLEKSKVA